MLGILKKKTKVILDTNFLIIPGEFGIDIFSEIQRIMEEPYEICVLDKTLEELQAIINRSKGKEGFNAKLGFIMAKQKSLKTIKSSAHEYTDKAIVEFARKNPDKVIVATQDKELKKALQKVPVRIIVLKQKKYLLLG